MPSLTLKTAHRTLGYVTLTLGILSIVVVGLEVERSSTNLEAYFVKTSKTYEWKTLSAQQVMSGATIPPDTHIIFHLPENFSRISREVLLGQKGKRTRYWGYCFPANDTLDVIAKRTGFPGLIFLSEKERMVRAQAERERAAFTVTHPPTPEEIAQSQATPPKPAIRHQLDVFAPNTLCYIMTEDALAIGLDPDGDRLNDKLEEEIKTDPQRPDTDGDGLPDGIEYLYHTQPLFRDTDNDGIIDGIEDANWNGRVNRGETDPRVRDSDHDQLCDGLCLVKLRRQQLYIGEDQNLNGIVDSGETDPRIWDTDGDGIGDEVEYLTCIAENKTQCP